MICSVLRIDDRLQYDAKGVPLQPILKVIIEPQQAGISKMVQQPQVEPSIMRLPGRVQYLAFLEFQGDNGKSDYILSGWVQAEDEVAYRRCVAGGGGHSHFAWCTGTSIPRHMSERCSAGER